MSRLTDLPPEGGKVEFADLAYGRANGEQPENGKDYPADWDESGKAKNKPIAPLRLVQPRDVALWTKDESVKDAKKNVARSQHYIDYMTQLYCGSLRFMRSNISLTIGKQRL